MTDIPQCVPRGVETLPLGVPDWRWNLRKMALYRPDNGLAGRVLALDLDVVITGSLDDIASYDGRFANVADWYEPGKSGGCIVGFEAQTLADELYWPVANDHFGVSRRTRGSERKWYRERMPGAEFWQDLHPGQAVTFKPTPTTRLETVPDDARIVCFHGSPRPHESDAQLLTDHWRL
jgi:hypothetical protein